MSFTPVLHEGVPLGHSAREGDVLFFFGSGATDSTLLKRHFPNYEFARIEQVHGRHVVETGAPELLRADGHVTARSKVAPVIITADCVPVLLASGKKVAALHAGWRGVEANIVAAAASHFDDAVEVAAIGPHLARQSFEIGRDVAARLGAAAPPDSPSFEHPHSDPTKVYFDLTALVRAQLRHAYGRDLHILEFTPDTLGSPEYHSYRRDGAGRGRNLSFVVRNP